MAHLAVTLSLVFMSLASADIVSSQIPTCKSTGAEATREMCPENFTLQGKVCELDKSLLSVPAVMPPPRTLTLKPFCPANYNYVPADKKCVLVRIDRFPACRDGSKAFCPPGFQFVMLGHECAPWEVCTMELISSCVRARKGAGGGGVRGGTDASDGGR